MVQPIGAPPVINWEDLGEAVLGVRVPVRYEGEQITDPLTLPVQVTSLDLVALYVDGVGPNTSEFTISGNQLSPVGGWPASTQRIDVVIFGTSQIAGFAFRANATHIQYSISNGDWVDIVDLDTLLSTESVRNAGALMDSEVANLAALKAFDPTDYAAAVHTHAASEITSGTFANARISQSSVTQFAQANGTSQTGGALLRLDGSQGFIGAFGLGATTCPNIVDLDATTTPAGLWSSRGSSATAGTFPDGASGFGAVLVMRHGATDFVQIYYGVTTDAVWVRRYRSSSGGFQPWERMDNSVADNEEFPSPGASIVLTNTPVSKDDILVFFDGAFQGASTYTLSGNTITFTAGAPIGVSEASVHYRHY